MARLIPSFAQGYAHSAGESENPGGWRNLRGLWVPALGPTGLVLRDVSGQHNHGTLTNMDPATDWVGSPYGWALDFDGADDYVDFGSSGLLAQTKCFTAAVHVRVDVWGFDDHSHIFGRQSTNDDGWRIHLTKDTRFRFRVDGVNHDYAYNVATGVWYFLAVVYDGSNAHLFLDGRLVFTEAESQTIAYNTSSLRLGQTNDALYNFGGPVSQAGYWNRALTPSEIQQDYADPWESLRPRSRVFLGVTAPTGRGAYIIGGGIAA